jgi:hypothetical protein
LWLLLLVKQPDSLICARTERGFFGDLSRSQWTTAFARPPELIERFDPELRIRASPPIVLRRTIEAIDFIRKVSLSTPDRAWQELLQNFEAARDEWSAMEAVVHLELVLEAGGLLIEEGTAYAARSGQGRSRAA